MRDPAGDPFLENVVLAPCTTLGVGGPARYLVRATSEDTILEALEFARARALPLFVLGGGSNIVVSDAGFPGLVLQIALQGMEFETEGPGIAAARAGESWDRFVQRCVERNLAGVECLSGIPGSVGGTPIQNVGAYGQEVCDVIRTVRVLDRQAGQFRSLAPAECGFSYRASIFNSTCPDRYIVLGVTYALRPGGEPTLQYGDLRRHFGDRGDTPSLQEVRRAVLEIRAAKAMVLEPGDPDCRSVGSFFKNPVVSREDCRRAERRARSRGRMAEEESLPSYTAPGDMLKLPAAWLIERAGFRKGLQRGRVGLSSRHALALINRGGATAQDILGLMREIQKNVESSFGIELVPEPVFVGF